MTHLLVINSFGPMASSVVAGLSEKLGFMNLPVRKLKLHEYLTGERLLSDNAMKACIVETLKDHAKPRQQGGVNVIDRVSENA